ncbi:MAG: transposase [Verrucomicrobiales bacterium]
MSISGKLHWLHTASTPELVYLHIDKHRGEAALRAMGILEGFEGWVVHDFLSAYYRIDGLKHVLCNAHLLRDLICVHEDHGQSWAADMMALLLEAKSLKTANCPVVEPSAKTLKRLHERYVEILEAGYAINPEPERRSRAARSAQAWQAAQPAHASG